MQAGIDYVLLRQARADIYMWFWPYREVAVVRADLRTTEVPVSTIGQGIKVYLKTGWEVVERSMVIPTHPCAVCDEPLIIDDYLCPVCRSR